MLDFPSFVHLEEKINVIVNNFVGGEVLTLKYFVFKDTR